MEKKENKSQNTEQRPQTKDDSYREELYSEEKSNHTEKSHSSHFTKSHSPKSSRHSGKMTVRSEVSGSSRSSVSSRASLAAARAQAEAQAAKARLAYAEKELEIKVEKARLEATLDVLSLQKEADAAKARAEVMELAAAQCDEAVKSNEFGFLHTQPTTEQKVSEYINQHIPSQNRETPQHNYTYQEEEYQPRAYTPFHVKQGQDQYSVLPPDVARRPPLRDILPQAPQDMLKPKPFSSQNNVNNTISDLAKFLAKSQLVTGGLTKFDDKPESYISWKSTFQSTIRGLGLTATEELNLLIKWLGPESSEHAKRLEAINIRYPDAGVNMVWTRLEECYGSPEAIENSLFTRLQNFPKLSSKEPQKLRDLSDLLCELEAAKLDGYLTGLSYLDTARGVSPIVEKLPFQLQERWTMVGSRYKEDHNVSFPPFSFFVDFVRGQAKARNDPSFTTAYNPPVKPAVSYTRRKPTNTYNQRQSVAVHKTEVSETDRRKTGDNIDKECPIHHKPHPLKKCKGFRIMLLEDRKKLLKDNNICYRCLASTSHQAKDCKATIKCEEYDSERHLAALHPGPAPPSSKPSSSPKDHGGEQEIAQNSEVPATCTEVCGRKITGKSCSKICLVKVHPKGEPHKMKNMYAIIDNQSNQSLAKTEFFDMFAVQGTTSPYTLKTCAGVAQVSGRRACDYVVQSFDGKISLPLPVLIECNAIPNNREEIPTANVASHHPHLRAIATEIPPLDPQADILLLIGRDLLTVHKVRKQICGKHNDPFAQKLNLGWVIVGDVCLGSAHKPSEVNALKTHVLDNGRPSYLTPCDSRFNVKESFTWSQSKSISNPLPPTSLQLKPTAENLGETVFCQTNEDNRLAHSAEDLIFLEKMEQCYRDDGNSWVAPLPFRSPRRLLPNNRRYAYKRLESLRRTLDKKPVMKAHFIEFMQKMLDNKHAELAPPCGENKETWYLPTFGVYHPQKPEKIRVVFDSSAQFEGVSLNDVLLSGPDLNNTLVGVLLRFRKDLVAITADIEQMFYCFVVQEEHRDYLRFLWYEDNDLSKNVVDYRMRVHVFGNSPSPAVAIYGLRLAAKKSEGEHGVEARNFIEQDFYVDDALKSFPTEAEAIDVLQRAQKMLALSNLRLHKVASNKVQVVNAFSPEDRAKEIKDLDITTDKLQVQRSLGVIWNTTSDMFTFDVPQEQKPFTHRGVLSTINSLFDPLGLLAPVTIKARLAPRPELTIPRLELCAAVLAVELSDLLKEELKIKIDKITFFTDSKVVLGYIHNKNGRFQVYVNNRVQRIKQSSLPEQWQFVPAEHNRADHGSRSLAAKKIKGTTWWSGPAFLLNTKMDVCGK